MIARARVLFLRLPSNAQVYIPRELVIVSVQLVEMNPD